ncbi:hypothetical protein ACFU9Y_12530 [Streptomyces sp. NPDC057621]|uniref:Uncharacterized protein n=1 Tax=Streptomyces liliiviolaceus TaxID=2823109 RepID=A0A941B388_9ACTN|nr:hypothetical protein [Streptomyces liliiviolaceus]MBQ0848965.1 hypothetical protein [Streptomyces liliiviolaceus]
MNDKQLIEKLIEHPESYGLNGTYHSTAMFLTGVDAGRSGGLMRGFTEWLVVRRGELNSFYWHKLVLLDQFPDMPLDDWKDQDHLTPEQHGEVVEHLLALLLEFLDVRGRPQELGLMYARYEAMFAHIRR